MPAYRPQIAFGSVCSGIEAASVAWQPLGWRAEWFAEIEKFPSAVLAHHWPAVPNHGDMLRLPDMVARGDIPAPDVLVGGTPCQAFSVAGKRESLTDERGALTLAFVDLANEIDRRRAADGLRPTVVVWENVPGVLSTNDNAFGCFLAGLAGETVPIIPPGGRWSNAGAVFGPKRAIAWRILDAKYFGVPQERRRVYLVASAGNGADPCEVLFEREGPSVSSAEARASVAPCVTAKSGRRYNDSEVIVAEGCRPRWLTVIETERLQGFPDDHTLIPWRGKPAAECPDGPRYKTSGNSMPVPVMRWIGSRIARQMTEVAA